MTPFWTRLAAAAAIASLAGTAVAQECADTQIRLSYGSPIASDWTKWVEAFKAEVEDKSEGRISIRAYSDRQLFSGSPKAEIDGVLDGIADATLTSTLLVALFLDNRFDLINMPFLVPSHEVAARVVDGEIGTIMEGWAREKGLEPIGWGVNGFRQLTNKSKEVKTPADMKGMKIRVAGSKLFIRAVGLLGADPITMSFSELYPALQQGVVEGQENPLSEIETSSFYNVQDYVAIWNYVYDPLILLMNEATFAGMCEGDQQILRDAAVVARDTQRAIAVEADKTMPELLRTERGMTVTPFEEVDFEAFREIVYPTIRKEWAPIVGEENLEKLEAAVAAE